ncbi:choice-of-anchor M domain-containing protein [Streptomyces sp. MP131-18]|uniref:choice-of-anchor M domain-containing protein n=1 Tax=Streptomyces sp. MP131-18 TaxID=1857892 RepID=UPI00097BBE74|nr:choice-of-anchor M domain-containing protein [Streptomyces sp. MP131-18]ONK14630.1 putative ABC transporter-associated repeat protein [Streptomyces sp. MP131-18]
MLSLPPPPAGLRRRARNASVALGAAAVLLGTASPAGHAQDGGGDGGDGGGGLEQTVAPEEDNIAGEAVLNVGHVDIGPRFVDGEWHIHGRDDSQSPPVWRPLTDVVTQVVDASRQQAPDDPDFGFLDAEPGSDLFVIPQTQAPEVIWLGWNTQDPEVMERVNRGVTLTMHGVEGPGHFAVFLQNGDLGAPDVLWDGDEEGPQELWVDLNTHTHANWVFTEPGVYVVDFEVSADLITGEHVSARAPLRFAVGEETDVREAFDAGGGPAAEEEERTQESSATGPPAEDPEGGDTASDEEDASLNVVLIAVGAVALALLAAVVVVTARSRRARRIAAATDATDAADTGTGTGTGHGRSAS